MNRVKNTLVQVELFATRNPNAAALVLSLLMTAAAALFFGPASGQMVAWGPATGGTGGV